ncbi:hypothetical protein [Pseudidiomarina insulisalsae]|uniref:Uncharacterized protein n=1 Tax=Pseudidiomarina insulisalsae TaxID=575789 RepID=A0A432YDF7_9GAMM|nr:hypothetical protein [Pseudidiomarina insulisalsae]RUO59028.1 hypothetical protein CWI71_09425 [Pseudidiomarina insulisalsae]
MLRICIAFVLAVLAGAIVGSIIQTQFNLAALVELSVPIPFDVRISTIIHDLIHFSPIFGVILVCVLIVALPLAYLFSRVTPVAERWWFIGAGFMGVLVGLEVVNLLAPMPTLIAATRGWAGLLAMAATGALAGWIFDRLWHPTPQELAERVL